MTDAPRLTRTSPAPRPGIVHLGPGAFFRAFCAVLTQDAVDAAGGDWGIIAVSLQSRRAHDQLMPQEGAFTSVTLGPDGATARQIGVIRDVLVAPSDPACVIACMADPAIRIVTLTITEKGYCHAPSTGALDLGHPDICHDLAHPDQPKSAPGLIVAALAARRAAGAKPFTVLSCDNLPDNGAVARGVILDLAREQDPDLAAWIAAHGAFPSSMVDRITPATTDADIARLASASGTLDPGMVQHEAFSQWVIEESFVDAARPAWDRVGVQIVANVAPYETLKLRCLNGTHSAMAYLGYLAGYETIAEVTGDPVMRDFVETLWHSEILPTFAAPQGLDPAAYCTALMGRYRNPAIRHRTWQIAMDGSQKLPQRLLGTLAAHRAAGRMPMGLVTAIAGWVIYSGGRDLNGGNIDVRDPLAARLADLHDAATSDADLVARYLNVGELFDSHLSQDDALADALTHAVAGLRARGVINSLHALISQASE